MARRGDGVVQLGPLCAKAQWTWEEAGEEASYWTMAFKAVSLSPHIEASLERLFHSPGNQELSFSVHVDGVESAWQGRIIGIERQTPQGNVVFHLAADGRGKTPFRAGTSRSVDLAGSAVE